jgi:anti-sigma-K factor RskA
MHGESDRLSRAGSYVLGLMEEADRERAEHDLEVDPAFREAVLNVAERLHRIELPRTGSAPPADWKRIAMHIAGLPQMRGLADQPPQTLQPRRTEPEGRGRHATPTRTALVAALCLIAAFAAGYLTALMRM